MAFFSYPLDHYGNLVLIFTEGKRCIVPCFPTPFCNHLVSHRRNLRANDKLELDSSDATVAAVDPRKGAVVDEDDEFVDLDELEFDDDDFSVVKLAYNNGEINGLSLLHGDIHEHFLKKKIYNTNQH